MEEQFKKLDNPLDSQENKDTIIKPVDEFIKKDLDDVVKNKTVKERKTREPKPYTQFSKKELWDMKERASIENFNQVFSPEAISHISTGLLMGLEMITTLPYTKSSEPTKQSLDASLSNASNVYLKNVIDEKSTPLVLIALSFSAMTLEALKNKTLNKKVVESGKDVEKSESFFKDDNESKSLENNEIPQI